MRAAYRLGGLLLARAMRGGPAGGQVARHDRRYHLLQHDLAGDQHPPDVGVAGDLVHDREQNLFEDRAQPAGAGAAQDGLVGHGLEGFRREVEFDAVQFEQPVVLPDERIARLGEDPDQRGAVQTAHTRDHRESADELRDHAELQQVFRHDLGEDVVEVALGDRAEVGAEAKTLLADPRLDDPVQTGKGSTADEQHVGRVDLDELLVGVLATALRGHVGDSTLDDLQQSLLNAFTGDVPRDRGVLRLPRDLVDLVDVDDAGLGAPDVVVGRLNQLQEDVLDVFADVAGLGQRGRVGDGERHVQHAGERLRQVGLAAAGRADQENVGLGQLDAVGVRPAVAVGLDPLVVVVDRYGERLLGLLLTHHILIKEGADLHRLGQFVPLDVARLSQLFFDDLVAQIDA